MYNNRPLQSMGSLSNITPGRVYGTPLSTAYLQTPPSTSMGAPQSSIPPPLPARQAYTPRMSRYPSMGGYSYPYSRYSGGMFGGYGMGMGMGMGMSPYGAYGAQNGAPNSFIQMAEESTRPAFESIESVVQVVSSISMMLESTYHAVYSSYSAILGVVDQFARLKDHLAQILSVLALLRGLRWLCLKVLYLLRIRKDNPTIDDVWNTAERLAGNPNMPDLPDSSKSSAWPFLMFIGLVIGAPWLMFKLLSKAVEKKPFDLTIFKDENGKYYRGIAAYDFEATQRGELSFRAGEKFFLLPKSIRTNPKGWLFAMNERKETGLIPANYLKTKQIHAPAIRPQQDSITPVSEDDIPV